MRVFIAILVGCLIVGCGDLSEQRANQEKLKEGLKRHQVMRVTDDEIVAAAHTRGDSVLQQLNALGANFYYGSTEGTAVIDSLNSLHPGQVISFIEASGDLGDLSSLELQLLEAYQYSAQQNQIPASNVQLMDDQWVLFTSPVMEAGQLIGMWSIRQSKKEIVLGM